MISAEEDVSVNCAPRQCSAGGRLWRRFSEGRKRRERHPAPLIKMQFERRKRGIGGKQRKHGKVWKGRIQ